MIDISFETPSSIEKKILIAKKFAVTRNLLAKVLTNLGYEYEVLSESEDIEDKISTNTYDIIFTDDILADKLSKVNDNIALITSSNTVTKDEIEDIIKKYRG